MELTPDRLARLQQLFEAALEQDAATRSDWLRQETGDDAALLGEVEALIAAHERDFTAFDRPALQTTRPHAQPDDARWLGQRIGPWRVTRRIGHGGMGTVYEAQRADAQFEKRVAIKFLHHHAGSASAVERFRTERQILANLNHPHVATLLDGGVTEDGQPYLVMEYIDGEPITAWADARNLDRRTRVDLFLQVCTAVEAAHRSLIVHRDLKPGNILVSSEGRVKLLDFGIARLLGDAAPPGGLTHSSDPLSFTPDYAAPEQMRAQPVSTATDVFALGVVLYRLLAHRLPFASRHDPEQAADAAMLDADLDAILARALQVRPEQRYESVQELRSDLEHWRDGLPVAAHPDSRAYRVKKFVRRHRAATLLGTVMAVAILSATTIALWQAHVARRAASDQQQLTQFLLEVLRMSSPFDEGDEMTLSEALDRAAEQIDERFADRPDLSAEIRFGIGYSMVDRYRLEQAEVQLLRALAESTAEFGAGDIRTLRVVEGVAGLRLEQSRYQEAERDYRQVIDALAAQGRQDDPLYGKSLGNLGNLFLIQERYTESDPLLLEAQALQQQHGYLRPMEEASLLSNLAHSAHGLEDQARADTLYEQAGRAMLAVFPEGSPDLAVLYNNHALLREERGAVAEALHMHERSLAIRRQVFRNEHPMVVTALSNVARTHLKLGAHAEALRFATEGAAMAERVYTEPNRFHPSMHATLAAAQLANGNTDAARASWLRARDLLAALDDPPPGPVRWVEEVRQSLCVTLPPTDTVCRQ